MILINLIVLLNFSFLNISFNIFCLHDYLKPNLRSTLSSCRRFISLKVQNRSLDLTKIKIKLITGKQWILSKWSLINRNTRRNVYRIHNFFAFFPSLRITMCSNESLIYKMINCGRDFSFDKRIHFCRPKNISRFT